MTKKQSRQIERPGVDRLGRTPLHDIANGGNLSEAASLLANGADPNARDDNGWTPLHFAAQSGALEVASLLLNQGAEVNAADLNGNTPLFRAVFACTGDGSLISALRAAGADPLLENIHGVSPVALARNIANHDVRKFFADIS
jgi:ankyrin repeat protein